ncbi:MAG: bifunctional phosphoribosylaminoimidazolecarboxamide formyltransferase/IMP cyclohydrolase [Deltaproteobacteria bacterium]|nr:bifunctional phosphoribosylaminoimidazolecarboxamide formyltransferase/IMP cyclohydrolase [Deltaproteobacteria bacterium]
MSAKAPAPPLADLQPVRRALISVSDKHGIVELGRALAARGVEILSTGGTAKALVDAGVKVTQVSEYTGSPEIMGGRVKTLHPRVHGGILMRGDMDDADLAKVGGKPIDLVVVNLYPFEQTVAKGSASHAEVIEEIDIGGPSMVRSAAKSHPRVTVLVDPSDYAAVLAELAEKNGTTLATRARLAAKAFAHTAAYDGAIAAYLSREDDPLYPQYLTLTFEKGYKLRYGENPHQTGAFYRERTAPEGSLARAESLGAGGKELSFNNFVDVQAALDAVREFDAAKVSGCVIVKHTNPCGTAIAETLDEAYRVARDADPVSAFGGIVALNREVDEVTAKSMSEIFLECIVAPSFSGKALEILRAKKNLRLLAASAAPSADRVQLDYRKIGGGLAAMSADLSGEGEVERARVVTKRAPTDEELRALSFAWRVTKHVKSNAIVLAKPGEGAGVLRTVGVGAGQMSRVVSVEIALRKAGELAKGSVLGSDAFFPFPDGVETAARGGITAIAQPGGSVKDAEVIAAADAAGIAMVFTGVRHFRH